MDEETKVVIKCPMCGCEEFDNGLFSGPAYSRFRKDGEGLLTRYPLRGEDTYAKRCTECGFVAIFTE